MSQIQTQEQHEEAIAHMQMMESKSRVGVTVIFFPNPGDDVAYSNNSGTRERIAVAALITRVWSPYCVNLKIFPDCGPVQDRTSVVHSAWNAGGYSWCFLEQADQYSSSVKDELSGNYPSGRKEETKGEKKEEGKDY